MRLIQVEIRSFHELDDAIDCGVEHPNLEGNYCSNPMDHIDQHEDLDGNEWLGNNNE